MEPNTGYIVTEQNLGMLSVISGFEQKVLRSNIGWATLYVEDPYPRWLFLPKKVAESQPNFKWADTSLNGLPARSVKKIRKEWAEVNKTYTTKLEELQKELERAQFLEGDIRGSDRKI